MLEIEGLTKLFGGLTALNEVNMSLKAGEKVGLIGPNGAGKTTFFNLLSGALRPTKGRVVFQGKNITGKKSHQIARRGLARTFQAINIYPEFTVLQNLQLSCHLKPGIGFFETVFHTANNRRKEKAITDRCYEILDIVGLDTLANVTAQNLAHGHKRILGIAIALASEPKMLLLDEPLGGMNAEEVTQTVSLIHRLWEQGITIVLIEHNMRATMGLCQRIVVLNFGRKIAEGSPEEIQGNKKVIQAYLGADGNAA